MLHPADVPYTWTPFAPEWLAGHAEKHVAPSSSGGIDCAVAFLPGDDRDLSCAAGTAFFVTEDGKRGLACRRGLPGEDDDPNALGRTTVHLARLDTGG
jgi:hypothetical protein